MNNKISLLRNLPHFLLFIFLSILLSVSVARAGNVVVSWGNSCGSADSLISDEFGTCLADSDFVQLIRTVHVDSISDPDCQGNPSGVDTLIATSKIGRGIFDPEDTLCGCFGQNTTVQIDSASASDTTDTFYVRAWNDSTLDLATFFGDTRQHSGQEVWIIPHNAVSFRIGATDSTSWNTASEAPNVVTVTGTSISPATADPGDENVGMLQLDLVTNKHTSTWTAIRIINRVSGGCTVDSLDIDSVKIYKDDGDGNFDLPDDTLIGIELWGPGSEAGGEATVTLSSSQTLSTTSLRFFIAYDIKTTADPLHCVGACLDDSSFITIDSPDCVSNDNFPICSGDVGLPVVLSSFTATPQDNAIQLKWRTESEYENQGFHLHRSTQKVGSYVQITATLIPGYGTTDIPHDYAYLDSNLTNEVTYYYKLEAIGNNVDVREFFGPVSATPSFRYGPNIPRTFFLNPAKPTPFGYGRETEIRYGLPVPIHLTLKIYDATGKLVRTLLDEEKTAGRYTETWDGMDAGGNRVSSGVYFYRFSTNRWTSTRKLVFLR